MENSFIKNRTQLLDITDESLLEARELVLDLLEEGIRAASPEVAIHNAVQFDGRFLIINDEWKKEITEETKIYVIGGGKASGSMATALEKILGEKIELGFVNIPKTLLVEKPKLENIELHGAEHPVPKEGTITGTKKILESITGLTEKDLVICLISGGGSSLLELPLEGISLIDLQLVFRQLTKVGAPIDELNCVRKHLSQVKGGKLAKLTQPATIVSLIISDVISNRFDVIASGPTAPDLTSWKDVEKIFNKYNLSPIVPKSVTTVLKAGLDGEISDTTKSNDSFFENVHNFLITNNQIVRQQIAEKAKEKGLHPILIEESFSGEARYIGVSIIQQAINQENKTVIIAGGESTVTIKGDGLGGRNQEVILAALASNLDINDVVIAALGTDGIDGPTDAAGALGDYANLATIKHLSLDITDYLERNDAYNFFKQINGLIITGDTGTNVSDIIVALKYRKETKN
ncbi:MAG: glycerate kinase type-2 family protein [Candidatus Heimdallarchaeota archaeon]